MGALHELWKKYRGRVGFVVVYIAEIHPTDGWETLDNREAGIAVTQPVSFEERAEVATTCALRLEIEMPVVVDPMDNPLADAYGALPDRLYLVGVGGTIAFQGERGPQGFEPGALESAIERALASQ